MTISRDAAVFAGLNLSLTSFQRSAAACSLPICRDQTRRHDGSRLVGSNQVLPSLQGRHLCLLFLMGLHQGHSPNKATHRGPKIRSYSRLPSRRTVFATCGLAASQMDWDRNWRQLEEAEAQDPQQSHVAEAGFAYTPFGCVRVALWLAGGGLLLFNAISIARIEGHVERRVAEATASTTARLQSLEREVVALRGLVRSGAATDDVYSAVQAPPSPPSLLPPSPQPPPAPPPQEPAWREEVLLRMQSSIMAQSPPPLPSPSPSPSPLPPSPPPPPAPQAMSWTQQRTDLRQPTDAQPQPQSSFAEGGGSDELLAFAALGLLGLAVMLCLCFCCAGALYFSTYMRDAPGARQKSSPGQGDAYAA